MSRVRVLLADDHNLVRAGIRALLETIPGVEVVAESAQGQESLELIEKHRPDVAILDIGMPGLNGVEVARSNAPAALSYNSTATANRLQGQAIRPQDIDLRPHLGLLRNGQNVLAIHALNDAAASSDFLLVPELLKVRTSANRYMATPTPGAPNSVGVIDFVGDTRFSVDRGFF